MAELERSVIRERIVAGLAYARERGTKSGRPVGRPRRIFDRDQFRPSLRQCTKFRSLCSRSLFVIYPLQITMGSEASQSVIRAAMAEMVNARGGAAASWASATR